MLTTSSYRNRNHFSALLSFFLLCLSCKGVCQSAQVSGQWSKPQSLPTHAIHAISLPTGKVLFWNRLGDTYLYDPSTQTTSKAAEPPFNTFCAGHTLLADGSVFVAGGHIVNYYGLNKAAIYNPFTDSWKSLPDMAFGRWYPTCTTMPNGKDVLVVSGEISPALGNATVPEYWDSSAGTFRQLTGAAMQPQLYPMQYLTPKGTVVSPGPLRTTWEFATAGLGSVNPIATANDVEVRSYGSSAMFAPGKILVGGGGSPKSSCEILDLTGPVPTWTLTGSMSWARRQHDFTLLPTGDVLATGGSSGPGFTNSGFPVYAAELWSPSTGIWTSLAPSTTVGQATCFRGYHSNAVLLPDGTIWSTAGDDPTTDPSYLYPNYQIFTPPYLFTSTKPVLTDSPHYASLGQSVEIAYSSQADIAQLNLVRLSAVTHCTNMTQVISKLSFQKSQLGLQAQMPTDATYTPPGYYYLFAVDANGGVSQGRYIQLGAGLQCPQGVAVRNSSSGEIVEWTNPNADAPSVAISTSLDGKTFNPATVVTSASSQTVSDSEVNYVELQAVSDLDKSIKTPPIRVTPAATSIATQDVNGVTEGLTSVKTTVVDSFGIPAAAVPVQFSLAGAPLGTAVTDENGYAELSFRVKPGWNGASITEQFLGQGVLGASSASCTLHVAPRATSMWVGARTGSVGQTIQLRCNMLWLPVNYSIIVPGLSITFSVDGVPVATAITDSTGFATAQYVIPDGGAARNITASFSGNSDYGPCSSTTSLTVNPSSTYTWVGTRSVTRGSSILVPTTLYNTAASQYISNATLRIQVNGTDSGTLTTDSTGYAYIRVSADAATPNTITLTSIYDGDATHKPSTGSSTVTVSPMSTSTWVGNRPVTRGSTVVVPTTLLNTTTKLYIPQAALRILINGSPAGTVTTDSNGYALVSVPTDVNSPASIVVTSIFDGDAIQSGSQGTGTVTVSGIPTYDWVGSRSVSRGNSVVVPTTLMNPTTKVYIPGANLRILINGANAGTVTTDSTGSASVTVPTDSNSPASIVVTSIYDGDSTHAASQNTGTVTVSPITTAVWVGSRSVSRGGSVAVPVTLQNTASKAYIPGATLRILVNGVAAGTVTTDSTGSASVNFTSDSNSPNSTVITAIYDGDPIHVSAQGTGTVTVK